jgi:DtxR family transcriptional regulator, Mn-dependent transcriptional regulator
MTTEIVSASVQDYAKAVYSLQTRAGGAVSTSDLAERMGVSPASASGMARKLAELGLAEHEPYRGVQLTPAGTRVALEVIRHHRLLELFLTESLGMSWDRVHAEAEVLEHVLSEELEELIAARLGHPTLDPHGDPIPSVELEIDEGETLRLDELDAGTRGRFVRVSDSDSEMLRYLDSHGIVPGARFEVLERQPFGGPSLVRFGDIEQAIGGELAKAMRMEVDSR